jgi:hypothetical protein
MRLVIRKHGPKSYEADPANICGSPLVGRGTTVSEAVGDLVRNTPGDFGVTIEYEAPVGEEERDRIVADYEARR